MAAITHDGYVIGASPSDANQVSYSNISSGLAATSVQSAIDEVNGKITTIKDGTNIDSFSDVESALADKQNSTDNSLQTTSKTIVEAINELKTSFQDGVDDVYDAIVAKGTTPASKSLSDVVTGIGNIETIHTTTYTPTSRASNVDMGQTHSHRYVNTTEVPNSNSGTYSPTTKSTFDLGATNTYRYVDTTGVANVNSGTYSITSNGIKDMTATNTYRYANVAVPNSNSGTYDVTANGVVDMGSANSYRYANVNVPHPAHTTTYTPTSRASNCDMGSVHSYRYVDTRSVPNSNSGTYTPAGNSIYDMGSTNNKRYCDGRTAYSAGYDAKKAELTQTYTPTSRSSNLDMGSNHTYRYVDSTSVPNSNSGTYTVITTGIKDMEEDNSYRYVRVNINMSVAVDGGLNKNQEESFTLGANKMCYIIMTSLTKDETGRTCTCSTEGATLSKWGGNSDYTTMWRLTSGTTAATYTVKCTTSTCSLVCISL